ncbi:pilus assembly protein [Brevibacillus borstelensis]|uniref:pilus assembly protein n=1 Tax=Brevibacillus borstelensis TaxID=45462 RepID=UPI0030C38550
MTLITDYIRRFAQEEDGVTIVEMVIIIAIILIVLIPTLQNLGSAEDARIQELETQISK